MFCSKCRSENIQVVSQQKVTGKVTYTRENKGFSAEK